MAIPADPMWRNRHRGMRRPWHPACIEPPLRLVRRHGVGILVVLSVLAAVAIVA